MVDIVERGSPAYFSKIKKGDILVAVQGTKVTSLSHASKLLKSSFKRFTIRIERKRCLINHQVRKNKINSHYRDINRVSFWHFKFQEPPQEIEVTAEKVRSTPQGSPAGVRRRLISDFDQAQLLLPVSDQ